MTVGVTEAPLALVEGGRIAEGFFRLPVRRVDMLSATKPAVPLGRLGRRLRLKEWVGFGICHPDLYGGILVQHAGFAASGAVYLYDRRHKRHYEWSVFDLPTRAHMPESLWHDETRCGRGDRRMRFEHDLDHGRHRIDVAIKAGRGMPAVRVDLELRQDLGLVEPLVISLPIGREHHTYTHKSPLETAGTIRIGADVFTFDPTRDLCNLDEQKTYYPYRSAWWWGSFAVRTAAGRAVMLNVVNQMTSPDHPGEDAMWVDGKLQWLPRPTIEPAGEDGVWRIADAAGRMQLTFRSAGAKTENMNLGLAAIDYAQHYGEWSGTLVDDQGETHRIDAAFGALERMQARF